ncbi:MAG: acyl-CoA thioesterase [Marinirhabdus sp.]|nr:acyl-CoA thioesterase [Marinirhabdus sp.]
MKKFSHHITVPPTAIDENEHVNNVVYLQWCIDVAEKHWEKVGPKSYQESHFWVVLEHHISYKNPAFEGEELRVETWVTSAEGVKSERSYKIMRVNDDTVMVEAKTTWCFMAIENERPARIPEEIQQLFL